MTEAKIKERLTNGGNYSIIYLLKISGIAIDPIYLCNNNVNVTYLNKEYIASNFIFTPANNNTGCSLTISSLPNENNIYETIATANYNEKLRLDVYEVIIEGADINRINYYTGLRGNFNFNAFGVGDFVFNNDDRDSLIFPPFTYDSLNNKGNA